MPMSKWATSNYGIKKRLGESRFSYGQQKSTMKRQGKCNLRHTDYSPGRPCSGEGKQIAVDGL